MAHIQRYYISEVLKDVCGRMKDVAVSVFPDHRPTVKNEQMGELVVVSIPNILDEQNAWQKGFIQIELIVRDKSNGFVDMPRLEKMLNAVTDKFPIVTKRYTATSPRLMLKGDDGLGFTIWNVRAKLIINTTDSYK